MASPTDSGARELGAATDVMNPMRVAKAFRDAADSIVSWPHSKLAELARACKVHDVTAPVRIAAAGKALDELHQAAWNGAIDQVIETLKSAGGLDAATEGLILDLKRGLRAVRRG